MDRRGEPTDRLLDRGGQPLGLALVAERTAGDDLLAVLRVDDDVVVGPGA